MVFGTEVEKRKKDKVISDKQVLEDYLYFLERDVAPW